MISQQQGTLGAPINSPIMDMIISLVTAAILLTASILVHYEAMIWTRAALSGSGLHRHAGALLGMGAMIMAQLISVLLYAFAYFALESWMGVGGLEGEIEGSFIDQLYFSLMSYTTLGVGDIYPMGGFRIISGIEALNGFALIGWMASFAYTLMRNGWDG